MVPLDRLAPTQFLRIAYEPEDWIAILLKTFRTGKVIQRIMPMSVAVRPSFQAWLRRMNAHDWNVYVSVNALQPGRSRAKQSLAGVRHLFLDVDKNGLGLLADLTTRPDLPPPSYVLHSSPGRLHVFWRTRAFDATDVERLQKRLARELETDPAATSSAQLTRLPGFTNHKHAAPFAIFVEYLQPDATLHRADFPPAERVTEISRGLIRERDRRPQYLDRLRRAQGFLRGVEPAVAGQHGDLRTFRVCCRIVRGFDLSDDDAMSVLNEWNARCVPPWSDRDLREKVRNARRYGQEPIGGLLS
jgi:hypothetical protein